MKRILAVLSCLSLLTAARAQERLPREEALRYAALAGANTNQLCSTPVATDVDLQKPVAIRDEDFGGMVLPQKNLTEAKLKETGEAIVPLGQLWLRNLTLVREGQALPASKLRIATVDADGEAHKVPQCVLGLRRTAAGVLELVILGRDKEPLLTAPLKATESKQENPLDLDASREGDSGRLTLKILGKYEAVFTVTELEPQA